ncbi:MAG: hypothetical protein K0Q50_1073 [Vampirovibrio sp.]|jgi:hypothetical protein|nr:hypothetical protein [Vampirovibrio sp.]
MMENGRSDNGYYNETDIIETTDEEGQVHIFEKVSELEVEGQEYALLIYKGSGEQEESEASKESDEEEEVVVMKISYEDGQEVYEAIEDEEEFERVVAFIENMDDDDSEVSIDLGDFIGQMKDDDSEEESKN